MNINRVWAMPNSNTFSIKPIRSLIDNYMVGLSIDPFANESNIATITNDIDDAMDTNEHMEAIDFLRSFSDKTVDTVLFDPPYSPRQVSECYRRLDKSVNMTTTQSSYWGNIKKEIGRIVRVGGYVITCGWNSGGVGKVNGFEIVEVLLVAHGGWHNDTIVTVDRCVHTNLFDAEVK